MVEPFENVSGSTVVWWLVVLDAAHVACVNGSVLMWLVAAPTPAGEAATTSARPKTLASRGRRTRKNSDIDAPYVCAFWPRTPWHDRLPRRLPRGGRLRGQRSYPIPRPGVQARAPR